MKRLLLIPLLLALGGCLPASARDSAVTIASGAADVANISEGVTEDLDRAAQDAAIAAATSQEDAQARVAKIRATYHSYFQAHRAFRLAWVAFAAYVKTLDASQQPDPVRLAALQKALQDSAAQLSTAALALEQAQ